MSVSRRVSKAAVASKRNSGTVALERTAVARHSAESASLLRRAAPNKSSQEGALYVKFKESASV